MKNLIQKDLFILFLLIFIVAVHILAMANFWYWTVPWLDIPMHFLGGFWVAALFFWLFSKKLSQEYKKILGGNFLILLILCLGFVSLVCVLWEFYEFSYDHYIFSKNSLLLAQGDVTDTMTDLLMDLIGGFVVVLLYKIKREKAPSLSSKNSPEKS